MSAKVIASALLLSGALLSGVAGETQAQGYRGGSYGYDSPYNQGGWTRGGEVLRNPAPYVGASDQYGYPADPRNPNVCVKLCNGDNSPCDPIQFKTADNRCSNRF